MPNSFKKIKQKQVEEAEENITKFFRLLRKVNQQMEVQEKYRENCPCPCHVKCEHCRPVSEY